ncbi:GNAT family N-acetyltransferase [Janthinobacterium sp. B9-8]|uniref:GNAT family N-acetyltransferase n=1 Tax=Janthinobacterium sp. B9-8 TaxID=1236179 RepID=UPI00061D01FF|nr:GNAT family protein [Janthinobacterium sp. B9-8]AMC34271.1 acetyltransferase [Janthinobacterium sp. B9-8]
MLPISTQMLLLRDFTPADLNAYKYLRSDKKFQRFYSEEDSSPEKSEFLLNLFIQQAKEQPRSKYQLAIVSHSGELMGSCGIRIEAHGNASIGCELGRHWHGTGAAKQAAQAIINFGFRELNVQRIYAESITNNKAAIRLCESLGMYIEAERVNEQFFKGKSWSTVVLAMSRKIWGDKLNH